MALITQSLIKVRCCVNSSKHLHTLNNICQKATYSEEAAESAKIFTEEPNLDEENPKRIRNISTLRESDYRKLHGFVPFTQAFDSHHHTLGWKRRQVGLYGLDCGIDPSICFATKEEMEELKEYEKVAFDRSIKEIRNEALQKIDQEKKERVLREERVIENLRKTAEWKRDILERVNKKATEVSEAQKKRERLLEEVRRYFGYTIDIKDEKFQYMLEFKEAEQKKQAKLEKKKKKEQLLMQRLAALGTTTDQSDQSSTQTAKSDEKTKKNSE